MSDVHVLRQGFTSKSALPNVTRPGGTPVTYNSTLLLLGEGTNGSNVIVDSSVNNYTLTQQAATSVILDNTQAPPGMTTSMYFAGGLGTACPRIYTPAGLPTLGTQDWCWEMYFYATPAQWTARNSEKQWFWGGGDFTWKFGNYYVASPTTYGINLFFDDNGSYPWFLQGNSGGTFTLNQWNHWALTRQGSTWRGFVNGQLFTTLTFSQSIRGDGAAWRIGGSGVGSLDGWNGWISNLRFTLGTPVYTANFTPPTLPLSNSVTVTPNITNNIYGVYQNY